MAHIHLSVWLGVLKGKQACAVSLLQVGKGPIKKMLVFYPDSTVLQQLYP